MLNLITYLKDNLKLLCIIFCWGMSIAFGLYYLENYNITAGPAKTTPEIWPKRSGLHISRELPTLIMFAHPHCSCSKASLNELDRIIAQTHLLHDTYVVFYKPKKFNKTWLQSDLWKKAQNMQNVKIVTDEEGLIARLFGVQTSGHTVLYGSNEKLLFSGGITASRAHEGDNAGKSAILSVLKTGKSEIKKTKAFGCTLYHDGE